ncbi:MAG: hypothetical protein OXI87_10255 [Albidovulum sp.]|nr:hypothetical protein [Albidovulum sp.]
MAVHPPGLGPAADMAVGGSAIWASGGEQATVAGAVVAHDGASVPFRAQSRESMPFWAVMPS